MRQDLVADENLLARLDRMPLTRSVIGIIALLSVVWLAEAFDIGIVGPVIAVVKTSWHLTSSQQGLLGISSTLGVVLGMIPAGILADRIGRKRVVIFGILVFAIITLIGAFVQGLWGLSAVRFFAGLGEGAVLPMPYLFLAEFVRIKRRAVSVGYTNGILTAAYLIPSLAGKWAIGTFSPEISWRIPFLLGAIPLLITIPLAIWLPESPRFLLKRGRREEVRALVERLEDEAGLPHDTALINRRALAVIHKGAHRTSTQKLLFKSPYLQRMLTVFPQLTGALILFYILLTFGPELMIDKGFGTGNSILFTGLMMGVAGIGSIAQGYLADKYGRKSVLSTYFLMAAIGSALFGLFSTPWLVVLAGFLTSFFGLGVFPVSKLSSSEQFPTRLRGQGVYNVEMTARVLSGVITLYFIPYLLSLWGNRIIFEGIAVCLLVLAIPFLIWGRETANISVEEAGTDLSFEVLNSEVDVIPGSKVTF